MSGFLLDANIPSELFRPHPDSQVTAWLQAKEQHKLFLSVVTIGELRKGVTLLPADSRRVRLEQWIETGLLPWFSGRILPVTQAQTVGVRSKRFGNWRASLWTHLTA